MASKILLIEDDAALLSMIKAVLECEGYCVTTATSGSEGQAKIALGEFDAVITDMRMETNDAGYQVIRAAATKPNGPVVVVMTAFPILPELWREAGAHAIIQKAFRVPDLLKTVATLLSARRASRTA